MAAERKERESEIKYKIWLPMAAGREGQIEERKNSKMAT